MPAQGSVPAAAARRAPLTLWFVLVAAAAALAGYAIGARGNGMREVMAAGPPGVQRIAFVTERACEDGEGLCQTLWLGTGREDASPLTTLPAGEERVEGIAWARDGYRVGFLVNGYRLKVFNPDTRQPVATVDLIQTTGSPSARIARGITFSQNGAAVTFDDCPRDQSGCRPGMAAIR